MTIQVYGLEDKKDERQRNHDKVWRWDMDCKRFTHSPILSLDKLAFVGGLFLSSINFILALLLFIISWFDIRGYGKMHTYLTIRFFALALLIFFISLGAFMVELSKVPSFGAP